MIAPSGGARSCQATAQWAMPLSAAPVGAVNSTTRTFDRLKEVRVVELTALTAAAHSDLGLTWYSKTRPPTVPRISAMPTATNHHWSKASANPSTLADAAIPIGQ
jgi:hypothetical protein